MLETSRHFSSDIYRENLREMPSLYLKMKHFRFFFIFHFLKSPYTYLSRPPPKGAPEKNTRCATQFLGSIRVKLAQIRNFSV